MGLLVEGQWKDQWHETDDKGHFVREASKHRRWITPDGGVGPNGQPELKTETGRYHLFVSLACPWAHRTLIYRKLKGLEACIGVTVVSWLMKENGWTFDTERGASGPYVKLHKYLYQLYTTDTNDFSGRVTVPVLWDLAENRIVNNESADIIRIFNSAFDELTGNALDLYPPHLRAEIDALNERIYPDVNNGVYRAGFATRQEAYEEAYAALFDRLDELETRLGQQRYLTGSYLTEADWRLFTTLIRFDSVYHGHFKCNRQRISEFPNLSGWLRELYQWPGVAETVNFDHIKHHYYCSHDMINPTGIVPAGPRLALHAPHGRDYLPGKGIYSASTSLSD